jgi:hypothetical protein
MNKIKEYRAAASNSLIVTGSEKTVALIGWKPPQVLFVKLNTDGAYKIDQAAG